MLKRFRFLLLLLVFYSNGRSDALQNVLDDEKYLNKRKVQEDLFQATAEILHKVIRLGEDERIHNPDRYSWDYLDGRTDKKIPFLKLMKLAQKNYDAGQKYQNGIEDKIRIYVINNPKVLEAYKQRLLKKRLTSNFNDGEEDEELDAGHRILKYLKAGERRNAIIRFTDPHLVERRDISNLVPINDIEKPRMEDNNDLWDVVTKKYDWSKEFEEEGKADKENKKIKELPKVKNEIKDFDWNNEKTTQKWNEKNDEWSTEAEFVKPNKLNDNNNKKRDKNNLNDNNKEGNENKLLSGVSSKKKQKLIASDDEKHDLDDKTTEWDEKDENWTDKLKDKDDRQITRNKKDGEDKRTSKKSMLPDDELDWNWDKPVKAIKEEKKTERGSLKASKIVNKNKQSELDWNKPANDWNNQNNNWNKKRTTKRISQWNVKSKPIVNEWNNYRPNKKYKSRNKNSGNSNFHLFGRTPIPYAGKKRIYEDK